MAKGAGKARKKLPEELRSSARTLHRLRSVHRGLSSRLHLQAAGEDQPCCNRSWTSTWNGASAAPALRALVPRGTPRPWCRRRPSPSMWRNKGAGRRSTWQERRAPRRRGPEPGDAGVGTAGQVSGARFKRDPELGRRWPRQTHRKEVEYPTTDGRPWPETDHHRDLMVQGSRPLSWPAAPSRFYVSATCWSSTARQPAQARRSDFSAVRGVPNHPRDHYLSGWRQGA